MPSQRRTGDVERAFAVAGGDLHDAAVAADEVGVTGALEAAAPSEHDQGEQDHRAAGHGRFSSGALPAENGADLSVTGIRSPAGSL